jgi:dinuclear metal center YbgI/SA1388 family protein
MPTVQDIAAKLESIAPLVLAEEWDNVGLLVGDRSRAVERLMTCVTLTPTTAAEALAGRAEMVVVHHPLPFESVSRITTETTAGRMLWDLIGAGVAIYSAHTAFDSARDGINEQLAAGIGLSQVEPLIPAASAFAPGAPKLGAGEWGLGVSQSGFFPSLQALGAGAADEADSGGLGAGRCGVVPSSCTLSELAGRVKSLLGLDRLQIVGNGDRGVRRVAVACGSGGSFITSASEKRCDCLISGEVTYHRCLEAQALGMGLILAGHFASERFALVRLADMLSAQFAEVDVWASRNERDPLHVV